MFSEDSFFIDLVSNASMNEYPENSLSKFTNKLICPISLRGEWEVAINEIFYPLEFIPNIHTVRFALVCATTKKKVFISKFHAFDYVEGSDVHEILKKINEKIIKVYEDEFKKMYFDSSPPLFTCSEDTNFKVDMKPGYVSKEIGTLSKKLVIFPEFISNDLFYVLGFDPVTYRSSLFKLNPEYNEVIRASNLPNNTLKTTLMFIYTDIIREHPVGDTTSPLLRVGPLSKGSFESVGHITFANQYYYKLRSNNIETINIYLCDELGKQINFKNGRVSISLHFRRIRKN